MVLTSAVTTVLAVYSWRRHVYMEITDWWDGIGALVLAAALIGSGNGDRRVPQPGLVRSCSPRLSISRPSSSTTVAISR